MAQKPFGSILAEARERQGIDIAFAAQQLRIRADILHAIEHNDFARMPARGYTRNMVNAYARLLGLNAPSITRQYLDEANAYQVGLRHGDYGSERSSRSASRGRDGSSYQRGGRTSERRRYSSDDGVMRSSYRENAGRGVNARGRDTYSDRDERVPHTSSVDFDYSRSQGGRGYSRRSNNGMSGRGSDRQGGIALPANLPVIIGVVVAIILVIFIITQIVGCVAPKASTTNTSVPITGVSDTTGSDSNTNSNSNTNAASVVTETPPTSVAVTYSVKSGYSTYMEIYENDSEAASLAEVVEGPVTQSYSVTGSLAIKVIDNSAVTLKVDGSEVEMTADGTGLYVYSVSYADVLNQWTQTHKSTTNTNKNTTNTTTTTNTNTSTTSTSAA